MTSLLLLSLYSSYLRFDPLKTNEIPKYIREFAVENNQKTSKFFRIYNEIPTILLIVIIFVVIFKPL